MKTSIQNFLLFASVVVACGAVAPAARAQADKLTPELSSKPRARIVLADRIVAVVNDEVITLRELGERMQLAKTQLRRQNVLPPADDVLERQVLERLIVDRAQLQFARENAIRVDDPQLTARSAGSPRRIK